jgi:hypothetical protein
MRRVWAGNWSGLAGWLSTCRWGEVGGKIRTDGAVAQLGERPVCTREVGGSSPLGSTLTRPDRGLNF